MTMLMIQTIMVGYKICVNITIKNDKQAKGNTGGGEQKLTTDTGDVTIFGNGSSLVGRSLELYLHIVTLR